MKIGDMILSILTEDPNISNEDVAALIRKKIPGATTSVASVASTKSRLRKENLLISGHGNNGYSYLSPIEQGEPSVDTETDEERYIRIKRRYTTLRRMAVRTAEGDLPSLIVSGPPGLGKSYTVEQVLKKIKAPEDYDILSGTISAVGLYILLYEQRNGGVIVLDDCDEVFRDENCLNILKAVLDSSETRVVSYRKRANWMVELDIPQKFNFEGSVVFCTNIDFEAAMRKGSGLAPHFTALIDRSLYLSLTMRSKEDFLTRMRQVGIGEGLLKKCGLTEEQAVEVMEFVTTNADKFYGLSIRLLMQIAACYVADAEHWKFDIEATKMRTI